MFLQDGDAPLHKALWEGHFNVFKLLLENGANINAENNVSTVTLYVCYKLHNVFSI